MSALPISPLAVGNVYKTRDGNTARVTEYDKWSSEDDMPWWSTDGYWRDDNGSMQDADLTDRDFVERIS